MDSRAPVLIVGLYAATVRRRVLTWGATAEEADAQLPTRLGMVPMEPGSLVMERKMLLGIKQRAEQNLNTHTQEGETLMSARNPKPTPDRTEPEVHHGTFAEGESDPRSFPEDDHVGTFAEGELKPDVYRQDDHVGTFADGECDPEKYPQDEHVGTFADGEART